MKLTTRNAARDLTEGSIAISIILFFLPIAAGALFQELYNAVDALIVGRYIGANAIAAVGGSAHTIIRLFTTAFIGFSMGFAVITGQYFGEKNDECVQKSVSTAIIISFISGLIISALIIPLSPVILRYMKTPKEIMADSVTYLRIYFAAISVTLVVNTESNILRAVGDSKDPLIYMVICCLINIVLDIVFVVYFRWGIAGAAYATIIAQTVNLIMATVRLATEKESYRLDFKNLSVDSVLLKKMLKIGLPSGLQHSFYDVTNIFIISSVNTLGTAAVAAWTIAHKVDSCYVAASASSAAAVSAFTAQNYGAREYARIRKCVICSYKLFTSMAIGFTLFLGFFGKFFISLYTDDASIISLSYSSMMVFVNFYFLWVSVDIIPGLLRGVGDVTAPVIITLTGTGIVRILWVLFVFPLNPTLNNVCSCYPITWGITSIVLIYYIYKKKWLTFKKPV